MVALREGATGISLAGLSFVDSLGQRHDGADMERSLREDSAAGSVLGDRLGLFINGFGNFASFDGNSEEAGFDVSEGGFVTGLDYRFRSEEHTSNSSHH